MTPDAPASTHRLAASESLEDAYRRVRAATLALAQPLSAEDAQIQSMPDVSPTKWHLAHTTWFFETFLLKPQAQTFTPFDPEFEYLYNSYYLGIGEPYPRARRGLISRPSLQRVLDYRAHVDALMLRLLERGALDEGTRKLFELGLHHEQQHQELILTDIKHVLWCNPLRPAYRSAPPMPPAGTPWLRWHRFDEAIVEIGAADGGFAFDNERPRHRVLVPAFRLASRAVTNGEYAEFIADGGYRNPLLWLSDGWATVQAEGWQRPLYWAAEEDGEFTLAGQRPLNPHAPVCHLSYYEADAFARWAGARLPTEQEWERAAGDTPVAGNFIESRQLHPQPAGHDGLAQLFGDVWEWTASPYVAYPGYRPAAGAVGEYNGKFMCNQMVLRGGSCASSASHLRVSYRNFFPPSARWQFSGLRLARDA